MKQSLTMHTKYDLTTISGMVMPADEAKEFEQLRQNLHAELQPRSVLQETLFDHILTSAWSLRRYSRVEAAVCEEIASNRDLVANEAWRQQLHTLSLIRSRREDSLHRSIKQLRALQADELKRALKTNSRREKENFKTNPNRHAPGKVTIQ